MTGHQHVNPRLAAALRYAQAGWPVFPCLPGQKAPATKHGFLDATTDPDKITWWWSRDPGRNVAIATGAPGPGSGFAAFNRLHREGLLDGVSAYIRTPSGGLHAYFTGTTQRCAHLAAQRLDFLSAGGYVLAPPSAIDGRPYQLIKTTGRTGTLDWAAASQLLQPGRQPQQPSPHRAQGQTLDHLAIWVAAQPEGNRNSGLYWAANRALEADPAADLSPLAIAARQAGLTDLEITRTLNSARHTTTRRPNPQAEAT
jgi:Bifunctional DNA primase/polymerase, N-terminal